MRLIDRPGPGQVIPRGCSAWRLQDSELWVLRRSTWLEAFAGFFCNRISWPLVSGSLYRLGCNLYEWDIRRNEVPPLDNDKDRG